MVNLDRAGRFKENRRSPLNADIPDDPFNTVEPSEANEHYVTQDVNRYIDLDDEVKISTPYEQELGTVPRKALGQSLNALNASWGSIR